MGYSANMIKIMTRTFGLFFVLLLYIVFDNGSTAWSQGRPNGIRKDTCCNENDSIFKDVIEPTIEKSRQKYLRAMILVDRNEKENAAKYFEDALKNLNILAEFPGIDTYDGFLELVQSILTDYNNYIKKADKLDNKSIVAIYRNKYFPDLGKSAPKKTAPESTVAIKVPQQQTPQQPVVRRDSVRPAQSNSEILGSIIERYRQDSLKALNSSEPARKNEAIAGRQVQAKADTIRTAERETAPETDTMPQLTLQQKLDSVPLPDNEFIQKSIDFLTKETGRRWMKTWLERGGKWFPMFKKFAKEEGVPEAIIYSSIIESGMKADIVSTADAVGMWQFMLSTGQMYGLNNPKSPWLDERRDFEKSTAAAMKHYKDLFYEFEDWHLAIAAYNCGVGCVKRALKRSDKPNPSFWDIREFLPKQTRNHVPLFIAVAKIVMEPVKYGFYPNEIDPEPELAFDAVTLKEPVSLKAAAYCANTSIEKIQELNPEILKGYTPPGVAEYRLRIPQGSRDLFVRNYNNLSEQEKRPWLIHNLDKTETLKSVADLYGISYAELLSVNGQNSSFKLKPGTPILVPVDKNLIDETDDIVDKAFAKSRSNISYVTHIVNGGETVYSISQKYNVRLTDLRYLNGLSYEDDKLPSATKLKVPVSNDPSSKRYHFEKLENPRIVKHVVDKGENLDKIADYYDVTTSEIVQLNNLKSSNVSEGQVIKIVTRNSRKNYNTYPTFYASADNNFSDLNSLTTDLVLTTREGKTLVIHRVGENESLSTIAQKYETRAQDIVNWNKSKIRGDKVYPGTNLKIYKQ